MMKFDVNNQDFTVQFELDTSIKAPTEFYVNEDIHYPHGFTYTIYSDSQVVPSTSFVMMQSRKNYYTLTPTDNTFNGKMIKVEIVANESVNIIQ